MPRPSAVVRLKTLIAFVENLVANVRAGGSMQSRGIGRNTWLVTTSPRYWFPGQVRRRGAGVYVHPFFVNSGDATGGQVVGLGDQTFSCPSPGFVMLVTRHRVTWSVQGGIVSPTTEFLGAEITTGGTFSESIAASVQVDTSGPTPVIVSQRNDSIRCELIAVLDGAGRVCHPAFGAAGIIGGGAGISPGELSVLRGPLIATLPS